jgi:hypothetical protein
MTPDRSALVLDKLSLVEVTTEEKVRAHYSTLYLLAMGLPDGSLLVKIGTTERPLERYLALSTGIPFESVMYWTPAEGQYGGSCAEGACHMYLAAYNTIREWFLFRDEDALADLRKQVSLAFHVLSMPKPQWRMLTEGDLRAYVNRKNADKKAKKRVGRMLAA